MPEAILKGIFSLEPIKISLFLFGRFFLSFTVLTGGKQSIKWRRKVESL